LSVSKIYEAIQAVDDKITEQVKKGTSRDKRIIKTLQVEHAGLSKQYANMVKPDRITPISQEVNPPKAKKSPPLEAFCQKCKSKQIMTEPVIAPTKGGKNGAKGTCGVCNGKLFRLVKN